MTLATHDPYWTAWRLVVTPNLELNKHKVKDISSLKAMLL